MVRPVYESAEDRKNQHEIGMAITEAWGYTCLRLKRFYPVDFAFRNGSEIRAFGEIKQRRKTLEQLDVHGGIYLGLDKWARAKLICNTAGVPFVYVVRNPAGIFYYRTTVFDGSAAFDRLAMGGRLDRDDDQDIEPVVCFLSKRFERLKT
jgi:hypothetical protein